MEITVAELVANPQLLETAMENDDNWFVVNWYLKDARNVPLEIIEKHYENAKNWIQQNIVITILDICAKH